MALRILCNRSVAAAAFFRRQTTRSVYFKAAGEKHPSYVKRPDGTLATCLNLVGQQVVGPSGEPVAMFAPLPQQISGPDLPIVELNLEDGSGVLLRVSMPGVGPGEYRVELRDAENRVRPSVWFEGREGKSMIVGGDVMTYSGRYFPPDGFEVEDCVSEIKDGILRVLLKGKFKN